MNKDKRRQGGTAFRFTLAFLLSSDDLQNQMSQVSNVSYLAWETPLTPNGRFTPS